MQPVLGSNAQPVFAKDLCNFCHRAGRFKSEIANNHERVVDEHARPLFQFRERNARINVAVVIRASDDDVRGIL